MYIIIQHAIDHDFAIVSKEEHYYYNDGIWSSSIKKLLQSPNITKIFFSKKDAIHKSTNFSDFLKNNDLIFVVDISTLDYEYIETNYPELLI